jgi:hypothetical protein
MKKRIIDSLNLQYDFEFTNKGSYFIYNDKYNDFFISVSNELITIKYEENIEVIEYLNYDFQYLINEIQDIMINQKFSPLYLRQKTSNNI